MINVFIIKEIPRKYSRRLDNATIYKFVS